jgi:hypothetical protein
MSAPQRAPHRQQQAAEQRGADQSDPGLLNQSQTHPDQLQVNQTHQKTIDVYRRPKAAVMLIDQKGRRRPAIASSRHDQTHADQRQRARQAEHSDRYRIPDSHDHGRHPRGRRTDDCTHEVGGVRVSPADEGGGQRRYTTSGPLHARRRRRAGFAC